MAAAEAFSHHRQIVEPYLQADAPESQFLRHSQKDPVDAFVAADASMDRPNGDVHDWISPIMHFGSQIAYAVDSGMDMDIPLRIIRVPSPGAPTRGAGNEVAGFRVRFASRIVSFSFDDSLLIPVSSFTANGKKGIVSRDQHPRCGDQPEAPAGKDPQRHRGTRHNRS